MIAWLVKCTAWIAAALPLSWALAWARQWGWLTAHIVRPRRSYVLATLARCLPEKSPRERRALYAEVCRHQALNLIELMRFAAGRGGELGARVDFHGEEHFRAALSRGKGALVLVAHFGNYDLMGMLVATLYGYPLTIITKKLKNEKLNELWWEMHRKAGVEQIHSHQAYRPSVRALRANRLVAFMLDQNRRPPRGILVDFFGQPAGTTPGLALMSAHTGAPVVPAFMRRLPDGRHRLEVRPPIEPPPDHREETLVAYTAAYTKIIEEEIRRYPAQWLWLHRRWDLRPKPRKKPKPSPAPPANPVSANADSA
jgi:KDO2-lipid IV(A) lauroyltransferase